MMILKEVVVAQDILIDKLEMILKEVIVAYLRYCPRIHL
jgi:hypothetical protein